MSHFDLDVAERASVAVTFEAVSSLVDFYATCDDIGFSPALVLGRDIRRQLGARDGFGIWRELMWQYEPPLTEKELLPGDPRKTVTPEQFDAALVEEWREYGEGEMHWTEMLLVDAMARAREQGWQIGNEVFALDDAATVRAATEAILNDLAARSGAKRATVEAKLKAASERRDARLQKFFDLDDAAYIKWLDAGAPDDGRGVKFDRWKERCKAEAAAYDVRRAEQEALSAAAQAEWAAFGGHATQQQIDAFNSKYSNLYIWTEFRPVVVVPLAKPELPKKLIQSSAEFVAGFVAPAYLLDGVLQKRFVYALTVATGAGKTAIALRLAAHVALDDRFRETCDGSRLN
jgi:hypothetical protein